MYKYNGCAKSILLNHHSLCIPIVMIKGGKRHFDTEFDFNTNAFLFCVKMLPLPGSRESGLLCYNNIMNKNILVCVACCIAMMVLPC